MAAELLTQLEHYDLSGDRLSFQRLVSPWSLIGMLMFDFKRLRGLAGLNLHFMGVHGPIPPAICSLGSLRVLNLSNNNLCGK